MIASTVKRSAQFAGVTTLGILNKNLPSGQAKQAVRRLFAQKLVELRGVPMKFSQILSMSGNYVDAEIQKEAIADITPMSLAVVETHVQRDAPELYRQIKTINAPGIPASLGQVHKVELTNGDVKALKIQYPDIRAKMDMDTALVGLLTATFDGFKEGFKLGDYQTVIQQELENELDYRLEASRQSELCAAFHEHPSIIIPRPDIEYSGEHHIMMSWERALPLSEFLKQADKQQKVVAGKALVDFFFTTVFILGRVHADPNPGNFGFQITNDGVRLVVYDFGSLLAMPKETALSLLKVLGIATKGTGDVLPWLVKVGFSRELLTPIRSQLLAFCEMLFEPFISEGRYDLNRWHRKRRAEEILGPERWNFMVAAPASFLPFMRAVQGLFYYLGKLNEGVFFKPFVAELMKTYESELDGLVPPECGGVEHDSCFMAANLKIEVYENGSRKVALILPRGAIESLGDFMDDGLTEKLDQQNIRIDDIVKQARQNGYRTMDLFYVDKGDKTIHVYLE